MKQKKNIRNTLKQALFISPNPPKCKKDYLLLSDFIFPNKELFISFLEEENSEYQITLAKDILLCITYDSHFAPPTRLLFNILDMDSGDLHEKVDTYIKRDHFVHLVHSYLLGVYIYFYHIPINEKLTKLFQLKRSDRKLISISSNLSAQKDVIIAWRYFILYHDLAYPFEYYLGTDDNSIPFKGKQEKYLKAYQKISKSLGKDLVFKSLSKVIAINNVNIAHTEENFRLLVGNYLIESDNNSEKITVINTNYKDRLDITETINEWGDAKKIAGIYGYKTLKNIVNLFPKEYILAVLFDAKKCPIVLYIPSNKDSLKQNKIFTFAKQNTYSHNVYLTKYFRKGINNLVLSAIFPFNEQQYIHDGYYLEYFYISPLVQIDTFLESLFCGISMDDYKKSLEYLANSTKTKPELITNENEFQQYCFEIYLALYKFAGYYKYMDDDPSIAPSSIDSIVNEANNLNNNIANLISSTLNHILKKQPPKDYFQLSKKDIKESVKNIFNDAFGGYNNMIKEISSIICENIKVNNNLITSIRSIRENVGDKFKIESEPNILINYENNTIDTTSFFNIANNDPFYILINRKLEDAEIDDFNKLFNNYRPAYCKNEVHYDHGICSAIIMIETLYSYESILSNKSSDINLLRLKNIAINADINYWKTKNDHKKLDILTESCFAIIIHNLYPMYLKNKNYKTDLLRSPFAYLAILTDSLQPWDRKYSANQAYIDLPYATTSNNFNIEIVKNKIRITESSSELRIEKRFKQLKTSLNDYLKNASENIEIILKETN